MKGVASARRGTRSAPRYLPPSIGVMSSKRNRRGDRPSQIFHVTARVNWRRWHLHDEVAKEALAALLRESAERFDVTVFAAVLMSNHLHAVVQSPPEDQYRQLTGRRTPCRHFQPYPQGHQKCSVLSQFMRRVRHCMSIRRQSQLGLSGRFWEGDFDSRVVVDDLSLVVRVAYDHRNPVKAHMVEEPEEHLWSTAREWATGMVGPIPKRLPYELPFGLTESDLRARILSYQGSAVFDQLADQMAEIFEYEPEKSAAILRALLEEHHLV